MTVDRFGLGLVAYNNVADLVPSINNPFNRLNADAAHLGLDNTFRENVTVARTSTLLGNASVGPIGPSPTSSLAVAANVPSAGAVGTAIEVLAAVRPGGVQAGIVRGIWVRSQTGAVGTNQNIGIEVEAPTGANNNTNVCISLPDPGMNATFIPIRVGPAEQSGVGQSLCLPNSRGIGWRRVGGGTCVLGCDDTNMFTIHGGWSQRGAFSIGSTAIAGIRVNFNMATYTIPLLPYG